MNQDCRPKSITFEGTELIDGGYSFAINGIMVILPVRCFRAFALLAIGTAMNEWVSNGVIHPANPSQAFDVVRRMRLAVLSQSSKLRGLSWHSWPVTINKRTYGYRLDCAPHSITMPGNLFELCDHDVKHQLGRWKAYTLLPEWKA